MFNTIVTPGSTSSSLGKTFDPGRHQRNVREWLVGYRTTLPDEVVIDLSFIDREYRDLPFAYKDRCTGQIFCPWLIQWNALVGRAFKITERQGVEADLNVYNVTNNGAGQ